MSVTIKDVAKRANVATSTVSRVISDSSKISEDTKQRVRGIMEEMGYHLNINGRVLVRQSTQMIGIVMKNSSNYSFDNPFFAELLRGISNSCHKQDYSINLTTGDSEEAIYREVVKMVQSKRVDGVIVLYSKKDDKVVPYLMERDFPFVIIGKPVTDPSKIMYVDNDNVVASKEATNYLINQGHQHIGFVGGDPHFEVAKHRLEGFKQANFENGTEVSEGYLKTIPLDSGDAKSVVLQLLNLSKPPTALLVTDDIHALSVILALQEKNIRVPEEMSVIGFNNTMISKLSNPPLTTVDTQSFQLGYESANSLIELLNNPNTFKKSVIIPTVIIERDSCLPITE